MLSKSQIKIIRSLHQKKFRDKEKLFIAEGPKVVSELLCSPFTVRELFSTDVSAISSPDFNVTKISDKELEQMSALSAPNQVLGVFEILQPELKINRLKEKLVLALDDLRDPGNLGTVIRVADWFGINDILCSHNCVDVYNPKVVQSTMGSLARVAVYYCDLESVLQNLSPVYATVLNGKNVYAEKLSDKGVILIGNESHGISAELLSKVTHAQAISIPNFSPKADSLNAAIATSIFCSEFRRRFPLQQKNMNE